MLTLNDSLEALMNHVAKAKMSFMLNDCNLKCYRELNDLLMSISEAFTCTCSQPIPFILACWQISRLFVCQIWSVVSSHPLTYRTTSNLIVCVIGNLLSRKMSFRGAPLHREEKKQRVYLCIFSQCLVEGRMQKRAAFMPLPCAQAMIYALPSFPLVWNVKY